MTEGDAPVGTGEPREQADTPAMSDDAQEPAGW